MDSGEVSRRVREIAASLGFERCGIAPAKPIGRSAYVRAWLDAGRAGSMQYLHRSFSARVNPAQFLPEARSVVVVALNYHQRPPAPAR